MCFRRFRRLFSTIICLNLTKKLGVVLKQAEGLKSLTAVQYNDSVCATADELNNVDIMTGQKIGYKGNEPGSILN